MTYGSVTNCKVRNGQTRSEYECRIGYEVLSQSIANNTSEIKLRLECRSINSSYQTKGSSGLTTYVDGTKVKDNAAVDMSHTNEWQNFGERTIIVSHNSDGTYSSSKSGSFTCSAGSSNYSLASGSASVTVNPSQIPRYATANQSLSSKTSTSITMNWSSDSTIDYIWYSKDNGANWTGIDVADGKSGSYTISGLSSNTTYSIKTRVRRKDSQLTTDSSALSITTYKATIPTISVSSKTVNSITVTGSCNVTTSSLQFRIKKNEAGATYTAFQNSPTFTGLDPNTQYDIQVKAVGQESGEIGYATIYPTTYDIAKVTSAPNINFGDTAAITKTNPSGATNRLRIETLNPTSTFAIRDNVSSNNYTLALTDEEWDTLYRRLGDNNSITIRYVVDTICNGSTYYHWLDRTCTLTGNQKTGHVGVSGSKKRVKAFVGVNGTVKRAVLWVGNNGRKRCI